MTDGHMVENLAEPLYLHRQLERASTDGLPAMRPLFVDFPHDAADVPVVALEPGLSA